jgi:histone deacetylase 1/2
VLYIDVDVHHGDGVEEAFFTTDRVMTVSFHQYGEFFPGTGELRDVGADKGKNYSVNFPLRHGIDDASYKGIFEPVISQVIERYRPGAIVLQLGGDSLAGDRLGSLNLSMRGHANCVTFVKKFRLPTLLLGGGGYTMRNVSRTWAYETGIAVGVELPAKLPPHEYHEYYAPDYLLDVKAKKDMDNMNSYDYLEKIKVKIFENLKETTFAPSVEMQDVPRGFGMDDDDEAMLDDLDEDENPDVRNTERRADRHVEASGELTESDDESGGSNHHKGKGQRNIVDHQDKTSMLSDNDAPLSLSSPSDPASPSTRAVEGRDEDTEMEDVNRADLPSEIPESSQNHLRSPSPIQGEVLESSQYRLGDTFEDPNLSPKPALVPPPPDDEPINIIRPISRKEQEATDNGTVAELEPDKLAVDKLAVSEVKAKDLTTKDSKEEDEVEAKEDTPAAQ